MPQRHIVSYFFFFSIPWVSPEAQGFLRRPHRATGIQYWKRHQSCAGTLYIFRFIYIHERTELLYSGLVVKHPSQTGCKVLSCDPNGERKKERERVCPLRIQRSQHNGQSFSALCGQRAKLVYQIGLSIALTLRKLWDCRTAIGFVRPQTWISLSFLRMNHIQLISGWLEG